MFQNHGLVFLHMEVLWLRLDTLYYQEAFLNNPKRSVEKNTVSTVSVIWCSYGEQSITFSRRLQHNLFPFGCVIYKICLVQFFGVRKSFHKVNVRRVLIKIPISIYNNHNIFIYPNLILLAYFFCNLDNF